MQDNIKIIMDGLSDNEFVLPVGYTDSEGTLHKTVKMRPMTGETEEAISDAKVRDNGGKVITELLYGVVEKLGALPRTNRDMIRDLTTIDRDFLILKNRQVSIGDEINYMDTCPLCRGKNDIRVDLSAMKIKYLEKDAPLDLTFSLVHGITDNNGNIHKDITIILPTGRVQERVASLIRGNSAIALTAMLQLITVKIGTMEYLHPDVFKKMTKKDRDLISNKISEVEAGVKLTESVICSECGGEFTTAFPLSSLLGE